MLMHRQAPIAVGALGACAVIATGAVLLRQQILTFASWPGAREEQQVADLAIPHARPLVPRGGLAFSGSQGAAVVGRGALGGGLGVRAGGAAARGPGGGLTLFAPADGGALSPVAAGGLRPGAAPTGGPGGS